jgi:glycyl-tRNA synthetase
MTDEMVHYASDCWDTELLTSYGWIECVGCADRSCYDLEQHLKATGVPFVATEYLEVPLQVDVLQCIVDKSKIGKQFKSETKAILQYFNDLKQEEIVMMGDSVTIQLGYNIQIRRLECCYWTSLCTNG